MSEQIPPSRGTTAAQLAAMHLDAEDQRARCGTSTMHKAVLLGREAVVELDGNRIVGISLSAGCGRYLDIDAKDLTEPEVRMVRAVLAKVERASLLVTK